MAEAQSPRAVVTAFARALDHNDFEAARTLLSSSCVYEVGGETLIGPDAVLASYAESARWVERNLDEVRYESEIVRETSAGCTVLYTDYLMKVPAQWHVHRCEQDVFVDAEGRVTRIVHRDLEGEKERLASFFEAAGIER